MDTAPTSWNYPFTFSGMFLHYERYDFSNTSIAMNRGDQILCNPLISAVRFLSVSLPYVTSTLLILYHYERDLLAYYFLELGKITCKCSKFYGIKAALMMYV